jgi:hypothetical protein
MECRVYWLVSLTIVVCFIYLFATRPSCREGFTLVVGGGTGGTALLDIYPKELDAVIRRTN